MSFNLNTQTILEGLEKSLIEENKTGYSLVSYSVMALRAEGVKGEETLKKFFINRNGGKIVKGLVYPNSNDYRIIKAAQTLAKKEAVSIEQSLVDSQNLSQAITKINAILGKYTVNENLWYCGQYLPVLMEGKSAEVILAEHEAKLEVKEKAKKEAKEKKEKSEGEEPLETAPQPKNLETPETICASYLAGLEAILENKGAEWSTAIAGLAAKLQIIFDNTDFADDKINYMQGLFQGHMADFQNLNTPLQIGDLEVVAKAA